MDTGSLVHNIVAEAAGMDSYRRSDNTSVVFYSKPVSYLVLLLIRFLHTWHLSYSYTRIDFDRATSRKEAQHGPTEDGVIRIHWSRVGSRIHGYYGKSTRSWYQWHRDARLKILKLAAVNQASRIQIQRI